MTHLEEQEIVKKAIEVGSAYLSKTLPDPIIGTHTIKALIEGAIQRDRNPLKK